MLSLLSESLSAKIVFSILLAGACAYLFFKIQKRKREAAAVAAQQSLGQDAGETLEKMKHKFFDGDNSKMTEYLRQKFSPTDVKHTEKSEEEESKKVVAKQKVEEALPKEEDKSTITKKRGRKPNTRKKKEEAKTVMVVDE